MKQIALIILLIFYAGFFMLGCLFLVAGSRSHDGGSGPDILMAIGAMLILIFGTLTKRIFKKV
jgi:hypothetical protein